jgi:acyl-CoA thioesterase
MGNLSPRTAGGAADIPADSQALAELTAKVMYSKDAASQGLDIQLMHVAPGEALMRMTVRPDMLNGHNICHGGFIFTLADSTFAFACNARNALTVASGCSIDYLAPGYAGDVLTAQAVERSLAGRTGLYDVVVTNQDGAQIALFRGRSYRTRGLVVPEAAPEGSGPAESQ